MLGSGRSAPTLLEDLILFDPRQIIHPGYHLLDDGPRKFAEAQYIGQLLPEGSCLHDFCIKNRQSLFPAVGEKPSPTTVWQIAAICQRCRMHLLLTIDYSVAWQDEPCPTWINPLHYLVRSTWRQDAAYRDLLREGKNESDEVVVYECSSTKCSAIVTVQLSPPVLPDEAVHILVDPELLAKRTNAAFELKQGNVDGMRRPTPLDVLADLRAYLRNSWEHNARTQIALDNKRFVVRFGPEGKACSNVLEALGFELKARASRNIHDASTNTKQPEQSWVVPQPVPNDTVPLQEPHNIFLDNVEAELNALIANRPEEERRAAQETTKLPSALHQLSRVLSCQHCLFLSPWLLCRYSLTSEPRRS